MDEIVNRVATSSLSVFDLEDYYQEGRRAQIDISNWLHEGFVLREKDFREQLKNFDWSVYSDAYVAIYCSTDAVLPAWAQILVATHVLPFAKKVVTGSLENLEQLLYEDVLKTIDFEIFRDKPVILKGCSKKPVPDSAYVTAMQYLQPVAKSVMYGEACSAVPLYKRR